MDDLDWPRSWAGYVGHVERLGKQGFEQALVDYKASKPSGQKHLYRLTDKRTQSQSPMTLAYTPVGKMFFQGSPRLLAASVSILPMRPLATCRRIVVEAYPAMVMRKWIGVKQAYKKDDLSKNNSSMDSARQEIVDVIRGHRHDDGTTPFADVYGLTVEMTDQDANLCAGDATGDSLDSVLCAIQAAWACTRRAANYGIPVDIDANEGWICDPDS